MFSILPFIGGVLLLACAEAGDHVEEQNEMTEGTVLFQSSSKVTPGVQTSHFDELSDLVDDFDASSKDAALTASNAEQEEYATGVDALPDILQDVNIPPRTSAHGWQKSEHQLTLSSLLASSARLGVFLQELLLVGLGLVGFVVFKGRLSSKMLVRKEAADTKKMTQSASLDTDELVQSMYADNKEHLQKLLQERSADAAEVWGCTALHVAAHCGCASAAEALLLQGSSANMKDTWDETPLHFAAHSGSTQVCELLVAYGANLDAVNANDCTPLVVAAQAGKEAVCKLLLSHGAGVGGLKDRELPPVLCSLLVHNMFETRGQSRDAAKLKNA